MRSRVSRAVPALAVAVSCVAMALLARAGAGEPADDPLASLGLRETTGAAPGYVDDRACGECHAGHAASYAHVGMARAFSRPSAANAIEAFGRRFVHEKSRETYELAWRDGRLMFRRWQVAPDGKPINSLELTVDWILGSGKHARTYLHREPNGELYQLPVAWYSQGKGWGMAPGYDRPDHDGVARRVRHECMFCHNAYPETGRDALGYWRSQSFPASLPEGIGCQRCHGPGAAHVRRALAGDEDDAKGAIVNPAKLEPKLRNDICYGCHMQPAVALPGIRRLDREIYDFRPGMALDGYIVALDVDDRSQPRSARFEINHHPYRLEQSRCFSGSEGRLSCLTCHDPHRTVAPEARAEHFRQACRGCHAAIVCSGQHPDAPADCVACHMPKRRTQDVVHVVMTDHRIGLHPGGAELLAPLEEREPAIDDVTFRDPGLAPPGGEGDVYRAVALLRATGGASRAGLARLEQLLSSTRSAPVEAHLDLAMAQLRQRKFAALEATAAAIVARDPGNVQAVEWSGVASWALGRKDEGLARLDAAVAIDGTREETLFNRGLLTATLGKPAEAEPYFERAVALRPAFAAAWHHLGEARGAQGKRTGAIAAYRRALEVDPRRTDSYAAIVFALESAGRRSEAMRYRRHGAVASASPETLERLIAARVADDGD